MKSAHVAMLLLAGALLVAAPAAGTELKPDLSSAFMREPSEPGPPFVVVGKYNLEEGLEAGYQSTSGKRIMIRARLSPKGVAAFAVAQYDAKAGKTDNFISPEKRTDGAGQPTVVLQIAGVDFVAFMKEARARRHGPSWEAINALLDSDTGRALLEAMPALFATLEPLESDPKLALLQMPLGVLVTGLQAATTRFVGFDHAEAIVGTERAAAMREACRTRDCVYQGAHFTVYENGMFDAFSDRPALPK